MHKVIIVLLTIVIILGLIFGAFYLLNEKNAKEMAEYIDTFASETEPELNPSLDEYGNWYFETDRDFKVLHLTDIHLVGGFIHKEADQKALNAVAAMVLEEKPDLVIITGDISYAVMYYGVFNNRYAHDMFIRLMENLNVYWTVTFGNHDNEPYNYYGRDDVASWYSDESLEKCLFKDSPEGVSGNGNHVINVKNTKGEVTQSLIMIDTHAYMGDNIIDSLAWNYDYVKQDQVDWYEDMIELYRPKSSLMFFHIPLMEVKAAYDEYVANDRQNTDDVIWHGGNDGEEKDVVYCSSVEEQLFEKVLELGNTKAMFFGHDHFNNFKIEYKGVIFSYGHSIDYVAYGKIGQKGYQRGCVVLNLASDGSFDADDITHENYYQDKYQPLYEKEVVDMYPYFDK